MHTTDAHRTTRARAPVARLIGAAVLLVATAVFPVRATASPNAGSALRVIESPGFNDSVRGWSTRPTAITVIPTASGAIYYTWGSPIGGWKPYAGTIITPEGKRTLHVALVPDDGSEPQMVSVPAKIDFRAPERRAVDVIAAANGSIAQVSVTVTINPHAGTKVIRIGGRDRYDTSALISAENFVSADTVIIATGLNFADALSASGLAGCNQAPILLSKRSSLPSAVAAEITRLGAHKAIIVGGTGAVAPSVADQLAALGLEVQRIGGVDRYGTAALISSAVVSQGQSGGRVFVARGDDFADALALGPLAYTSRAPLVLVKPTSVPSATRSFLGANSFSSGCIAGGTVAVSEDVAAVIRGYVPGLTRLAGSNRYSTAVAVADWGVSNGLASYENAGLATGTSFADALCGGVAAGVNGGVIYLTRPTELSAPTSDAIRVIVGDLRLVQIYGGAGAVYPGVMDSIVQLVR